MTTIASYTQLRTDHGSLDDTIRELKNMLSGKQINMAGHTVTLIVSPLCPKSVLCLADSWTVKDDGFYLMVKPLLSW